MCGFINNEKIRIGNITFVFYYIDTLKCKKGYVPILVEIFHNIYVVLFHTMRRLYKLSKKVINAMTNEPTDTLL